MQLILSQAGIAGFATLLEIERFAGSPAPSSCCLRASFKEIGHSGFMVAHKTLKDNKTCSFKTSALTQKKRGQCLYAVFFREPEPCNLLPLCQQIRVSNPCKPEGKSRGSPAGLAFLSPLCRAAAGHTGTTSSSCQGLAYCVPLADDRTNCISVILQLAGLPKPVGRMRRCHYIRESDPFLLNKIKDRP